ncbi:Ger(x)C family spore germination protein [Alkalihalobacillus deserti]|uniref:Ger(x)C family spore germination protein n=1 Tax=Alkalihalobacillus deserti TaxID=2879466 RepID=UPI001D150C78|nr:Ger(x)C family spore germination protein [Alkalihalobacillus deserti]
MIKRIKKLAVLLAILTLVTGCWNYSELNELVFILALGLDKEGDQITVTNQVINPSALGGEVPLQDAPVANFQGKGNGIQEALRKMTTESTRQLFVGHLQVIVISEKLAREGLGELFDHVIRDHDYGKDFFIVVAKGSEAQEILEVLTPLEQIPASKMSTSLNVSSEVWGGTTALMFGDLVGDILSSGKEAVVAGLEIEGNEEVGKTKENKTRISPPAHLNYSGLAVFKEDRLIGWLNENESRGYNFVQGNIKSTTVSFPCPNKGDINVEVQKAKEKTEFELKNGNPQITITVDVDGAITQLGCDIELSNPESFNKLEKETETTIKTEIEEVIEKVQSTYQADIFGFGSVINRANPTYWKNVQDDWDNHFENLMVKVEVNVTIKHAFRSNKSFLERMKNN